MLDAAAGGLRLILSIGIVYREHVDGNGLAMWLGFPEDLESAASTGGIGSDALRRACPIYETALRGGTD